MEDLYRNSFEKKLVQWTLRIQKLFIYRVIQRTVLTIFPFVLIGSFAKTFQVVFLGDDGFLGKLMPEINDNVFEQIDDVVSAISNLTIGWVSVIAVFAAAKYTAKYYKRDDQLAGITGSISLLIIAYVYSKRSPLAFHSSVLGVRGLLFAILLGIFIGYIFKLTSKEAKNSKFKAMTSSILNRTFTSMKSISLILLISVIFSDLVNITFYSNLPESVLTSISSTNPSTAPLMELLHTFGFGAYTIIMSFLGWSGPYSAIETSYSDPASLANLSYALTHHTAWGAPNLFNGNTLYHAFATFGGTGATLALLIAILWVSRDNDLLTVSRWSLIPSIFNINSGLMSGIPILFNIVFLIPFLLAPMVNMLIAALALQLHLMPPSVYAVPAGTPGPLIAFLGTNGSWQALIFSLITLTVSVFIYLPFVRIAERVKTIDNLDRDERSAKNEKK
ncbi:PTS transporter subunit EIIC [Companilactobacillus mishanensis]|uniref:Permease IIC component n=1 Tax=Companilactobacillus mishanensis TaxID=2486008 RepID=A0A5P0ZFG6_9LACO|nr:PTS transporter subunit EIIC [Companilactobacillus mishanensis]MQS51782.1 PTS sugar transporter subunit IIC [Companilactobacillus mishanensis]